MMGAPAQPRRSRHVRAARRIEPRPEHQPHVPGLRPRQPVRAPRPLLRAGAGRACGRRAGAGEPAAGGRELLGVFRPREEHQSYPGRLHGGVSSAILDETIGRAILLLQPDAWGVTVEFTVRFRRPLPLDEEVRCVARVTRDTSRLFEGSGEIVLPDGTVAVEATGKYLKQTLADITDGDFAEREWFTDPREAPERRRPVAAAPAAAPERARAGGPFGPPALGVFTVRP